jgi:hypothetical protein
MVNILKHYTKKGAYFPGINRFLSYSEGKRT